MIGFLRLVSPQGLAGIVTASCLAILLVAQKFETRHWRRESQRFEQLYRASEESRAALVADIRAAAATAQAADAANTARVQTLQDTISRNSKDDYESRISAARARAQRLRDETAGPADRRRSEGTSVSGLPASSGRTAQATGEDRLPEAERLIATEQAIQLDALIDWVKAQSRVERTDPDPH